MKTNTIFGKVSCEKDVRPGDDRSVYRGLVAAVVLMMWSVLYLFSPWYVSLSALVLFILTVIFLIKPEAASYMLIVAVMTLFNYVGFYFDAANIGIKTNKTIPVFSIILVLGAVALGIKKAAGLHRGIPWKGPLTTLNGLLILYAAVSLALWSPGFNYGLVSFVLMLINFALFYFIIYVIDSERLHKRLMVCWVVSGVITAVLVMLSILDIPGEFFYSKKLSDWVTFIFNNSTKVKIRGHALGHPNASSTILNMVTWAALGLLILEQVKWKKLLLWTALFLLVLANFLTMSKAGIGSFLIVLLLLLAVYEKTRRRFMRHAALSLVLVVIIFGLSLVYAGEKRTPRLMHVSYRGDVVSVQDRVDMWKEGWAQMKRRHLSLVGLGPGGFDYTTKRPHPHNLFLSLVFDYGLFGFVYATVLFSVFGRKIWNVMRNNLHGQTTYAQVMGIAMCGGLVALGIHSTVDQYYFKSIIWLFFALAISLFNIQKEGAADKATGK
ncbi:MAG: O-antigen ligase family protein [Nitrospirae bacterium]|nr:O-antigen ligase family protein [Nitrospirota bacterium]